MREGPNESMKAAVSNGAEAVPVTGFTQSTDRRSKTAPVRPAVASLIALIDPIVISQYLSGQLLALHGKRLGSRGTVAPLVLLA